MRGRRITGSARDASLARSVWCWEPEGDSKIHIEIALGVYPLKGEFEGETPLGSDP